MSDTPPYPKTRKRNLVPHLIGVPVREGINAVCVVLWQSRQIRNLITIGITPDRLPPGEYPSEIGSIDSMIDTSAEMIRAGDWHLGPAISLAIPPEVSMRIVIRDVRCDDETLRPCTRSDYSEIPMERLAGMGLVEHYIRVLDNDEESSKFALYIREIMEKHLSNYPIPM